MWSCDMVRHHPGCWGSGRQNVKPNLLHHKDAVLSGRTAFLTSPFSNNNERNHTFSFEVSVTSLSKRRLLPEPVSGPYSGLFQFRKLSIFTGKDE